MTTTTTLVLFVMFSVVIVGLALYGLIEYYSMLKSKRQAQKILNDFYKKLNQGE